MKQCRDCGEWKDLSEFYEHPQMKDGHLNSCKSCRKAYAHNRIVTGRKVEKRRYSDLSETKKAHHRIINQRWRNVDPRRNRAHCAVRRAVKKGIIVKPRACSRCERETRLVSHHEDYDKPLEVEWMCQRCHRRHHEGTF